MTNLKRRNILNQKQIHTLKLAYKFRFITAPLLAEYKYLRSRQAMHKTLEVLADQKYLGRHKEANKDFHNRGIRYYLAPGGMKYLRENEGFSSDQLHAHYKNKTVSTTFIDHSIETLRTFLALRDVYQDNLQVFTRSELSAFDGLPPIAPDLLIRTTGESRNEYFLVLAHDKQPFVTKKVLKSFIEHSEEEGWISEAYPTLLFIFDSSSSESTFAEFARKSLDNAGIEELDIRISTLKALNQKPHLPAIWTSVTDTEILISL